MRRLFRSRLVVIGAPVVFRLRAHWRGVAVVVLLGTLAAATLASGRALAGRDHAPALALPDIPAAGPALVWNQSARSPSETQAQSLGELLTLLSGLAWLGFAVAALSIFSWRAGEARERALDTGIRRAAGASLRHVVGSAALEILVLAALTLVAGVAVGSALLSQATRWWPGTAASLSALDPGAALALAAVLGAAGLTSLHLVRSRDLIAAPSQELGLGIPTYQVAASVALLMGAAALLGRPGTGASTRLVAAPSAMFAVNPRATDPATRAEGYRILLAHAGTLPGVKAASLTSAGAALGLGTSGDVTTDCGLCYFGMILIKWPNFSALVHAVSADTFQAQGIPLLEGRAFTAEDRLGGRRVAIVNRHLARRYYRGGAALGRDIFLAGGWPRIPYTVVGIVDDKRSPAVGGAIQPRETVYLSALQHPPDHAELLLTGPGTLGGLEEFRAARELRPLGSLEAHRAPQQQATRWMGAVIGGAALGVLLMALIGTAATVRRWTDSIAWELALRRAAGATRRRMTRHILVRTGSIGIRGLLLGVFLYAVVVVPMLEREVPNLATATSPLLPLAAILPMLLALVAGIAPGLRLLRKPPSHLLR